MASVAYSTDTDDMLEIDDLISLIARLQYVVTTSNLPPDILDLPKIAVIGEQGAGKTSVLENIVGEVFLPRGTGIVNRCPLVLQLTQSQDKDYAEFLHDQGKYFTDYADVKQEIANQTEKQAGHGKGISEQPINLKIYSPTVPNLTLVDLPSMTKNVVGDQTLNIRKLILKYIKQENTLILVVTPATRDLGCSDALQLAETVDPQRLRTIGIITKLDMMDSGTDARRIFQNKIIPLKRGYIGLVNRSQEDIDMNLSVSTAQRKEKMFFKTHPVYKENADKMGIKYLQAQLSGQLFQHVRENLPIMRAQARKDHQRAKQSLDTMNTFDKRSDETWIQQKIIEIVQKFIEDIHKQMEGLWTPNDSKDFSGGTQLKNYFTKIQHLLKQAVFMTRAEVFTLWTNASGFQNTIIFSQQSFNAVIEIYLARYKDFFDTSVALSSSIIKTSVENCTSLFDAYPYLTQEITRLMIEELVKNEKTTKQQFYLHLEVQKSYMSKLPAFTFETLATNPAQETEGTAQTETLKPIGYSNRENPMLSLAIHNLTSYTEIFSETIREITPKYISCLLVCKTLKYTSKLLADIQKENPFTLMRVSKDQLSEQDKFFRIYNATETALELMGDYQLLPVTTGYYRSVLDSPVLDDGW